MGACGAVIINLIENCTSHPKTQDGSEKSTVKKLQFVAQLSVSFYRNACYKISSINDEKINVHIHSDFWEDPKSITERSA